MNSARLVGVTAGVGLTCLWACWTIITRLGLETELLIFDLFALRLLVATVLVAPFLLVAKSWRGLGWGQYAVLGCLGGLPHTLMAYAALERTTVAHFSVFLYGMTPLLTAIAGYLLVRKKLDRRQLAGACIILSGIFALSFDAFQGGQGDVWLGNSMAVVSIALFAGYLVYAERWHISLGQSLIACTVLNALVYLPGWALFRAEAMLQVELSELLLQGGFQGVVPGILSFYIMTLATRNIGADMTALFFALIPIASAGLAVIVLGEQLSVAMLAGLLLTTAGIVTASLDLKKLKAKIMGANSVAVTGDDGIARVDG